MAVTYICKTYTGKLIYKEVLTGHYEGFGSLPSNKVGKERHSFTSSQKT